MDKSAKATQTQSPDMFYSQLTPVKQYLLEAFCTTLESWMQMKIRMQ